MKMGPKTKHMTIAATYPIARADVLLSSEQTSMLLNLNVSFLATVRFCTSICTSSVISVSFRGALFWHIVKLQAQYALVVDVLKDVVLSGSGDVVVRVVCVFVVVRELLCLESVADVCEAFPVVVDDDIITVLSTVEVDTVSELVDDVGLGVVVPLVLDTDTSPVFCDVLSRMKKEG